MTAARTVAARYHVAGLTEKGPTDRPVLLSTGAEFHATFGGRTTESAALYDDVDLYLREGGQQVWISRTPDLAPATVAAALDAAGPLTRGASVAVPGLTASTIGTQLTAHADAYGKLALLSGGRDTTPEELGAVTAALKGLPGSRSTAVLWPWVNHPNGRSVAPTGYVAAVRARAHLAHGYWKHPDGPNSTARTIRTLRTPNTPARNEELAEQLISPIVTTRDGVHLHGWWSLASDRANFPYLDTADLINNLAVDLADAYSTLDRPAWDTVARLKSQITAVTKSRLASLAKAGAFHAKTTPDGILADPGYIFTVTEPLEQPPDRNVIIVRVAVRPYTHATLIGVRVFRVPILDPFLEGAAA